MFIGFGMHLCLRIIGRKEFHERGSLMWSWKTREPEKSPAPGDQESNLELPGGSRSRDNDDALESDDSEQIERYLDGTTRDR